MRWYGHEIFLLYLQTPPSVNSTPQIIAQPRPSSHPPAVKVPEQAKPTALVDLLSLDTPTTASASSADLLNTFTQPPPASQPAKTSLVNEVRLTYTFFLRA